MDYVSSSSLAVFRVVEVTSLRRRSSGGGIQRQASIYLSDEEDGGEDSPATHVSAVVHASTLGRCSSNLDLLEEGTWPMREAESTEEGILEQHLERHHQGLLRQCHTREDEEEDPSLVSYNDMGSREEVGGERRQAAQEDYRSLWTLRATLEEESSEEVSPAASRRQNYQRLAAKRVEGDTSQESSLESSDTSRGTASFESTDSESQTSKLQQMKADSGYKSLESRRGGDSLELPDLNEPVFEKSAVFHRLFRPTRSERLLIRDFSIDEKSDHLFREFSRLDMGFEKSSRRLRYRLHCDPDSPRLGVSPECSIEEESEEESRCAIPAE